MEPQPFWERLLFVCLIPVIGFSLVFISGQPANPLPYMIGIAALGAEYVLWKRGKKK